MLKTLFKALFIALVGMSFMTSTVSADPAKGQKIILKKLKKHCAKAGIKNGGVLAKKHTQAQWKAICKGDLNAEIAKLCPGAPALKPSYAKHVCDFLIFYASDSGNVPSC